jgi:predicted dehydrogenase
MTPAAAVSPTSSAMHPPISPSRRQFLVSTAAATLGFPAILRSAQPSNVIRIAYIGVGGRGAANLKETLKDPNISVAALCDVSETHLYRAAEQHPSAAKFKDYRKLYDELQDYDAVVISTTEHTHASATIPALKLKKPVYCEKPLSHNVREAARIMQLAKESGVPTQMGTQIHASANYRRVVEQIQSGTIGNVTAVHVCVARAWGRQSKEDAEKNKDIVHVMERPKEHMPPPPGIDWDLWIGPAPYRPYHDVYLPGPKWYRWWDFGNGTMSDLGSHWNDLPWWALKLDAPQTIQAFGPEPHPELAPATMSVKYQYGPRGELPGCEMWWHQGATKPVVWTSNPAINAFASGVLFIGDKGMLISDYSKFKLLPEADFPELPAPKVVIPDSPGQHQEWLNAIRHGTPTGSPFADYAGPLTIANHLGNVAHRIGQKIHWDAVKLSAIDLPEAETFLGRQPREGWSM